MLRGVIYSEWAVLGIFVCLCVHVLVYFYLSEDQFELQTLTVSQLIIRVN